MDIIIHGKPNADSIQANPGTDLSEFSFARKIVDEFFEGMNTFKDKVHDSLVVDARTWKGTWYSVYSFLLTKNIRDRAAEEEDKGRSSYFAISIIIPQKYCCMTSLVYTMLKSVVQESVIGTYLSKTGKYLVNDFGNKKAFDSLCDSIRKKYVNLEEVFDSGFKAQTEFSFINDTYCNVIDCDSQAFVNLLKLKGRIIVTESAPTKDALAAQVQSYALQTQQAQAKVAEKDKTIKEKEEIITNQTKQIQDLQESARKAGSSANNTEQKLKAKIISLESAKEAVDKELIATKETLEENLKRMIQASSILNIPKHQKESQGGSSDKMLSNMSWLNRLTRFLPIVNTLLLILLMVSGLFLYYLGRGGSSNQEVEEIKQELATAKAQIREFQGELSQRNNELNDLRANNDELTHTLEQYRETIRDMESKIQQLQARARQFANPAKPQVVIAKNEKETAKKEIKPVSQQVTNESKKTN